MDQGMRSVGSMVMGAAATVFGAALGLSLCSVVSIGITTLTFYRLIGWPNAFGFGAWNRAASKSEPSL
jgi:hypothetical protein